MVYPRFSIGGILAAILVVAVGIAAICRPSCLWASAVFSLLLLALTVAFLGVLFRNGQKRAFWAGFLICGSLYAILSLAPWFDRHICPRLITTAGLDLLYPKIPPLQSTANASGDPWALWAGAPPDYSYAHPRVGFTLGSTEDFVKSPITMLVNTTDTFLLIGHSLFGLLAAIGGGVLAGCFHQPRDRSTQ